MSGAGPGGTCACSASAPQALATNPPRVMLKASRAARESSRGKGVAAGRTLTGPPQKGQHGSLVRTWRRQRLQGVKLQAYASWTSLAKSARFQAR